MIDEIKKLLIQANPKLSERYVRAGLSHSIQFVVRLMEECKTGRKKKTDRLEFKLYLIIKSTKFDHKFQVAQLIKYQFNLNYSFFILKSLNVTFDQKLFDLDVRIYQILFDMLKDNE
ncbi:hypothetical protein BpHYR1_049142 [Brachionus plicatilis]|uniref:Uncharacterized protein n=1 Tax=Brachionus plicatilis TaxID=10195 RepID=A0A3M7SKM1_BRAPC|nr:hypothetical protein BpHYR1_049142 [Brachionus plicatilis]